MTCQQRQSVGDGVWVHVLIQVGLQKEDKQQYRLLEFLKVLQLCAIALAQVRCQSVCSRSSGCCALNDASQFCCGRSPESVLVRSGLLQGLPLLTHAYPNHWACHDHPVNGGGWLESILTETEEELWAQWCSLQWDTFCQVTVHVDRTRQFGSHAAGIPPWSPTPSLIQRAQRLPGGHTATWVMNRRISAMKANPLKRIALLESHKPAKVNEVMSAQIL